MPHGRLLLAAVVALVSLPHSATAGGRGGTVVVAAPRGSVVLVRPGHRFGHPVPRLFVQPRSVFPVPPDPWRFWPVSVPSRVFDPPFFTSLGGGAVYTSTVSASPAMGYAPAAPVAVPVPAVMPMPTLIEYPTGWYQLRGDGVTVPYVWVWIPKPPSPPSTAPPPVPPMEAPPEPSEPHQRSSAPHTDLYRWVDDEDVSHWTDRLDRVPDRFRSRAQRRS